MLNIIKHVGGTVEVACDAPGILGASKTLLPGVGSFENSIIRLGNLALIFSEEKFGYLMTMHMKTYKDYLVYNKPVNACACSSGSSTRWI